MDDLLKRYNEFKKDILDIDKRGWLFHAIFNDFLSCYNKAPEKEKTFFRIELSRDIQVDKAIKKNECYFQSDLIHLCSQIDVPEAKGKLLEIFNGINELYNKDDSFAFLYRDLIISLSRLRTNEIKKVVFVLSETKKVGNSYIKMIRDEARKCLKYFENVL